jgi:hypothetical protein
MALFLDWMANRDTATLLRLLEAAQYFNPQDYNPVFESELEKLIRRLPDSEARRQAIGTRGFDFGGYISRSLLRAGFRNDDEQEAFQGVVVKLLVEPGRLFKGWEPRRHGPLDRRFRRSVWNAIRNVQEKSRNRRKLMTAVDPTVMAGQFVGREPYSDVIDQFRQLVAQRLGKLALAILDARLAGEDTKDLIGMAAIGTPSAFLVKRETRAIKDLARQFAQRLGNLAFAAMVTRAMDAERRTVEKRQAAIAAK